MNYPVEEKKSSAFKWLLGGCLTVSGVGVLAVVVAFFFGFRYCSDVTKQNQDPATREATAKQVLGAEALPEGYFPMFTLALPFKTGDMVVLTDRPPDPSGAIKKPGDHMLMYFRSRFGGEKIKKFENFVNGQGDDPKIMADANVHVSSSEILDRGVIEGGPDPLLFFASRGKIEMQNQPGVHTNEDEPAILSVVMPRCQGLEGIRVGVWVARDPLPGQPLTAEQLAGTPGDKAAVGAFFKNFQLCRPN